MFITETTQCKIRNSIEVAVNVFVNDTACNSLGIKHFTVTYLNFEPSVCSCLCANNVWYLTVCEYNSYLHSNIF